MENETTQVVDFASLGLEDRINFVDHRLGNPEGRVKTIDELIALKGKKVYMLLSPYAKGILDATNGDYSKVNSSECFEIEWVVGDIENQYGEKVSLGDEIDISGNTMYFCFSGEPGMEDKAISCKDFNIIPNAYNNHAVFTKKEDVTNYILYRRMMYDSDEVISQTEFRQHELFLPRKFIDIYTEIEKEEKEDFS